MSLVGKIPTFGLIDKRASSSVFGLVGAGGAEMKSLDNKPVAEYTASQENVLVESSYKMGLNEKRLMTLGMSKLKPDSLSKSEAKETPEITVSVDDWRQVFPDDPKPYRSIAAAADKLLGRHWRRELEDGGYRRGNWFSICDYKRGEGYVRLRFTPETALYLYSFATRFISARLDLIGRLSSFNQVRLYEMFYRYSPASKGSGYMVTTLDELREALQLQATYPIWNDFNRKVLAPSIKAINHHTNTEVTLIKTVKKGRKVHTLHFSVLEKMQGELDL